MPNEKRIIGAVGVGNKTYTAGMEDEFAEAAAEAKVDLDRLERKGVVKGYGKQTAEAMQTINRQRKADGSRADEAAVAEADTATEGTEPATDTTTTTAPRAAKKASRRKR